MRDGVAHHAVLIRISELSRLVHGVIHSAARLAK